MNTPRHVFALAALAVLLLSGCATDIMTDRDRAMMAGRYGEMEKHAVAEVPDVAMAKTVKLAPLCMSYAKLKRYDKLAPCLDQLEKNVAAGDTNMTDLEAMAKKSAFMMGMAKMGSAMAGVPLASGSCSGADSAAEWPNACAFSTPCPKGSPRVRFPWSAHL